MHLYNQKLNGTLQKCFVCNLESNNIVQHHIAGRRYSGECIWLCTTCHREVHANPQWAYDNGLMIKHNINISKMKSTGKKKKTCSHSATYWSKDKNDFICQFCGKVVGALKMGNSKKAVEVKKGQKSKGSSPKNGAAVKMGSEPVNPQIAQAVEFKRQRFALEVKLKKAKEPEMIKQLTEELAELDMKMKKLHQEMQD